ncbi:unnamed protein product [Rhizoctonia solani]|uniref:Uncharacterized protein n=1 Tax=Rhizoctonia solani TaxID=456999 RepID=A0A8H3HFD7_9AGAM|nr:unnamed protein product [Rhizoctonia solani]
MYTGEFSRINPDTVSPHSGLLPNLSQSPAHDRIPTTQRPSHKPRVVSDSAIISHQPYNPSLGSQESRHGTRYQRNLSVGSQPHGSTWIPDTGFGNLAPENSMGNSLNEGETFEDYFSPSNTAPELGYDGTQPIACILVNNPQHYLPRSVPRLPDPHSHGASFSQGQSEIETRSNVGWPWTDSQPSNEPLPAEEGACRQQLASTPHDRNRGQPLSHTPAPGPYSHMDVQMTHLPNSGSEYHQSLSTQSEMASHDKAGEQYSNNYHLTKMDYSLSKQVDSKRQDPDSQAPNRGRNGSRVLQAYEIAPYTTNVPAQSTMQPQSVPTHMMAQTSDLSGPDYAPGVQHTLQGQELTENPTNDIPVLTLDTAAHERDLAPPGHLALQNLGHQSLPNYCQPSASSHPPQFATPTWSLNPLIPVAGADFLSVPVVAVPAPRRSLNFGAFLTPDPPYQISNLDLPPRPGTSPPQRISVPNGRSRLLPNTGRRQSEQTWQSYYSQPDHTQLPPPPSDHIEDTNHLENYTHIPAVSRRQTWVQGQAQFVDNRAPVNYGPVPAQAPNGRALTNNEGQGVWKPKQLQHSTSAAPTLYREHLGQQRRTTQQNQSDAGQTPQKPSLQTQRELTTQSRDGQERTNQQPQALNSKASTQATPLVAERHSSERQVATKRGHGQGNPDNTAMPKKRKVVAKGPEATNPNTQLDPLVPPSQFQQQNSSMIGSDCVYFDANTWRGDDIANRGVRENDQAGSNTQNQPQGGHSGFVVPPPRESTGATSSKSSEDVPSSSEPPQAFYYGGGTEPPTGLESWLSGPNYVGQGEGASSLQYMNWDPSVDIVFDQIPGFESEVTIESRIQEQYATALNQLERPAPEVLAPIVPWVSGAPNNGEIDKFQADCYNWGVPSVA